MESLGIKCEACGATFRTTDELGRHTKTHESAQRKEKSPSDHSCSCCFE